MRQSAIVILIAGVATTLGAQGPAPKASPPPSARLYVLDCGMLTISAEGVARYHVTAAETGETRMPVPCYLVAHPKGTLMWDVGVIPDDTVEQAGAAGARYDVNPTAAALVRRTLRSQLAAIGHRPSDVTYVAVSHAHKDHTANLNQFAASTWLTPPAEREFMWKPGNERVEPRFYSALERSRWTPLETDEHVAIHAAERQTERRHENSPHSQMPHSSSSGRTGRLQLALGRPGGPSISRLSRNTAALSSA